MHALVLHNVRNIVLPQHHRPLLFTPCHPNYITRLSHRPTKRRPPNSSLRHRCFRCRPRCLHPHRLLLHARKTFHLRPDRKLRPQACHLSFLRLRPTPCVYRLSAPHCRLDILTPHVRQLADCVWAIAEPRIGVRCINTMVDLVIMCGIQPGGCGRQNDAEIVQIGMGNVRRAGTLVALPWPNLNCAAIYFCCVLESEFSVP